MDIIDGYDVSEVSETQIRIVFSNRYGEIEAWIFDKSDWRRLLESTMEYL